ncbi:MAG: hypothetical protein M3P04_08965 [Actinomycetota bacterium]|nr:hypothetical protein [Actinomycetota bacterium]
MISTIVNAFTRPLTSFAGSTCQGFVAATVATTASVGVCICCLPSADVGPMRDWASTTAPAAQQAAGQSVADGSAETKRAVARTQAAVVTGPSAVVTLHVRTPRLTDAPLSVRSTAAAVQKAASSISISELSTDSAIARYDSVISPS